MSDLARQNSEIVMWITQPEKFLALLEKRLGTYQKAYRTRLPPDELKIWCDALKAFSVQEFDDAMRELLSHPPKYQLDDGSVQLWRGMPKLPDVIQTMIEAQERRVQEYRRREGERLAAEMRDLERRRREGEHFYGLADVLKDVKAPEVLKPMPAIKVQWPDIDPGKNAAELERQKEILTKRNS